MKRLFPTALLCLVFSISAFSQSANSIIGGTVQDASKALIPGVMVTATNIGTGVTTTNVTNETGTYQFPSLQPGTYKLQAELPGFRTAVVNNYALGGSAQATVNFTLQVGSNETVVDVTTTADAALTTASNSVGAVLPEYKVRDLPLAVRDVFGLVGTTAGVQSSGGFVGVFAGGRLSQTNTSRDGISVTEGRFENGAFSGTYTSPDLVEEVKVIVAPVDAETSRGSGQVQLVTRSGTNQVRGSLFWVNHNSLGDASNWFNNFAGTSKDYDNRNQFGGRVGGPIVKNKTFFFFLYEGQRDLKRQQAASNTLSDMAKAGIFRYWPGVDNANAAAQTSSVDRSGNPVQPSGATGPLSAIDLFGNCTFGGAPVANCRSVHDPLRPAIDNSSYMQQTLLRMPTPNDFVTGSSVAGINADGLNVGTIRFARRVEGLDLANGNGTDVDRDQFNIRLDQNFNARNKLSLIATKEHTWGGAAQAGQRAWPSGFDGIAKKHPDLYAVTFTSTLTNNLLNEFRIGRKRTVNSQDGPANRSDSEGKQALSYEPVANGIIYSVTPLEWTSFDKYGGFGVWRFQASPTYTIGDDISWSHGKHSYKGGWEFRQISSYGHGDSNNTPLATLGAGSSPVSVIDSTNGLTANNQTAARNLLTDLAGSIGSINEAFGILSPTNTLLQGPPAVPYKLFGQYQSEMNFYFKDDWKFRPDLTLNLGIHWDYFGQPYEKHGLDARVIGGESAFTNVSCTSSPGTANFVSTCSNLAQVEFAGKNSTNPNVSTNLKGDDYNNFAPAVGFSWSLPWFGKNKTVLRSGYGISYLGSLRNFINVDSTVGTVPGMVLTSANGTGVNYVPQAYTSLSNITLPIPFPAGTPTNAPFVVPTTDRTLTIATYDHVSPYIQNWNLEIQREVARNTTVEIRYIGNKGTKLWGTVNLNQIDSVHHNPDIFNAFNTVRAGGDSPLLTQMMMGMNLGGTGACTVNGTTCTGATAVRLNTTTRTQLANGSVGAFASTLNTVNTGSGSSSTGADLRKNGFPENYFVVDPQYNNVNLLGNSGNSTYHAMQVQVTKRLSQGFTTTTTWTWSKALGEAETDSGITFRDPTNRAVDKHLLSFDHAQQLTSNGTYELPFGTGHYLLGAAPNWIQEAVAKWQLGGILNFNSGDPLSITTSTQTISNVNDLPNIVGAFPKSTGHVTKVSNGVVYFNGYTQVTDPYVSQVTATNTLNTAFSNKAIADPNGNVVLVNPQPGQLGTMGTTYIKGVPSLGLDMNLIKRFPIRENMNFEFRLDAISILNHANFADPVVNIDTTGSSGFGRITSATGSRSFILNTRVNF
jgi:hypothetical protein